MEETTEAVKEVARTTSYAIKTVDRLGQFFAKIMGESINATCGMLEDTLKYKRWEKQTKLVEKAERLIKEKNLSNRAITISAKLTLPIFQNASLEDDVFLHDLYARLLVSAIDPEVRTRRTAFVEILRQLEALDVKILQAMHTVYVERNNNRINNIQNDYSRESIYLNKADDINRIFSNRPPTWTSISSSELLDGLSVNDTDYWEAVDNLCRLGLVNSYIEQDAIVFNTDDDSLVEDVVTSHGGYYSLCITALGVAFVEICNYS